MTFEERYEELFGEPVFANSHRADVFLCVSLIFIIMLVIAKLLGSL